MVPNHQSEDLEALTYLYAKQLPIGKETLVLARSWLKRTPEIAQQLTDLHLTMSQAYTQLQVSGENKPGLNRLLTLLEATLSQMTKWTCQTIFPDTSTEEIAGRLANLVTDLGTPPESELAYYLSKRTQLPRHHLKDGGGGGGTSPSFIAGTKFASDRSALSLESFGQTSSPKSQPLPTSANRIVNPLYRLVSTVKEILTNPDLNRTTLQTLHRLANQLDLVSHDLGTVQLLNLANTPDLTTEPYYLFPMSTSDGSQTAHLKVYRRPGHQRIDPEKLRLALVLDLPALGEIVIDLTIFERRLSGKILSERRQTHQILAIHRLSRPICRAIWV